MEQTTTAGTEVVPAQPEAAPVRSKFANKPETVAQRALAQQKPPARLRPLAQILDQEELTPDQTKALVRSDDGRFAPGNSGGTGRRKGALSRISAQSLEDYEKVNELLGIKGSPLALLRMVCADDQAPLDIRVNAAKALVQSILPKMLEVSQDAEQDDSDNGGIVRAVAEDPTLQALYEAYQRRQVLEAKRRAGLLPPAVEPKMLEAPPPGAAERSTKPWGQR